MRTRDLIEQLSHRVEPVKPLAPPHVRFGVWLVAALLCVGAGVGLSSLRQDLGQIVDSPVFLLETVLIGLTAVFSAGSAFVLSVPGTRGRLTGTLPPLAAALWGITLLVILGIDERYATGFAVEFLGGEGCLARILILGVLPGVLLFIMIRQAAPLDDRQTGILAALAVAALGALGLQFVCLNNHPVHLFLWHFLPVVAVALLGSLLGRWFLNWSGTVSPNKGAKGRDVRA